MVARRAVIVLAFVHVIGFAVSAQEPAEFGRATGGEIVLTPKGAAPFSGSFSLSLSSGHDLFGRSSSPAYGVTAGGTLIQDRLWFFGAASRQEGLQTRFANLDLPENATTGAIGARVNGQIADNQDFSAFFEAARQPQLSMTAPSTFTAIAPSTFLSMRYTGIVSDKMFFNASFTRRSRTMQGVGIVPVE
jgi:hypothetical protein